MTPAARAARSTTSSASAEAPGPGFEWPGRRLLAFRSDPTGFLLDLSRRHGDVARFALGGRRCYLVSHPELVREVLVTRNRSFAKGLALQRAKVLLGQGLLTSEGDLHLRQRRLVQPSFHRERLATYGAAMVDCAERVASRWADGAVVDAHREMTRLTLAIVGRTLFGADVEREADEIREALTAANEMSETLLLPFSQLLDRLPLPRVRRFRRAQRRLDATIYRLIEERRADGADRGDLLSTLLLARDAEGDGAAMDDRQVRDEAMTLFLAGHETTAVALAWTWRLLSENPEAEALLHRELDEVLDGRLPAVEDVPRLEVTRGVFAESLRLYPPAWVIGRLALTAVEIGGFRVPRRSLVLTSPWVTHRDPRWWPDPSAFDPTRWSPAAEAARPRFAYFPFGGGPRVCIGEPFAWLEGILVLATLARGWRMRLVAGHAARLHPLITLRPRGGLPARLERRRPDRGLTRA